MKTLTATALMLVCALTLSAAQDDRKGKESGPRLRQHDRDPADRHGRHHDQVLLRQGSQARRELRRPRRQGLLRRDAVPPGHPGLHDPGRRPEHQEGRGSDPPLRYRRQRGRREGIRIKAEFNDTSHKRGIVSMARSSDPNSASSQFFIVVKDSTFLDGQYSAFGEVISGMEVADKIAAAPRGAERSAEPAGPHQEGAALAGEELS